ncbi:response regulator [Paenibacillus sp. sgz302251]|uniref:response regulator n=1 Tax=Paenibacillus sp. sgz302251 TaxID=3414493 RepID=UPI003C7B0145
MSLRTKGLILIVLISLIPLLVAGVGNYSAVKQAMLQSEMEKLSSKQSSRANSLAASMAIYRAEALVMSRTEVVRFGTDQERSQYFDRELVRSGFTYYSIGFIDKEGMAKRTDGAPIDVSDEPFFQEAIKGRVVITDPFKPDFSDVPQTLIVVPVYGTIQEVKGLVYISIQLSAIKAHFVFEEPNAVMHVWNDQGMVIFSPDEKQEQTAAKQFDRDAELFPIVDSLLAMEDGMVEVMLDGGKHVVFHTKVKGTPWRFVLQEPISVLEEQVSPIFWRIFTTIAVSEAIIVIFFYLYFERIIKRLEPILGVTEQAADGRFEAEHLAVEPHDEIGLLAHSVNGMMEQLQKMFDRLEAIINQNQYAFIVLDDKYKVSYLNKTAEEMLGYKTEELAGVATPLLFMDLEEIREEAEKLSIRLGRTVPPGLEVFKELRSESFSYEREWTFIHKDGTRIPTLDSSNGLRDRNGRFSGVVGMVLDISDRKHVEKARNRLLEIVESAKDLIASVDTNGRVVYMNRAGREMLGLINITVEDQELEQYVQPQMYAELVKGAEKAREFGFWESGAKLLKIDGQPVHVSMVVVYHKDEETGEEFFSCIARDISEQKMIQEKLVRATLDAEEANQAKSRFLALMSHEIRTPLNGIIGLAQLMRKTGLSASQKDYMDKMHTSSDTLLRIINDILDFSKIEAGKVDIELLPFQPDELMHRLTDQLSVFMGGKEQFEFIIDTPEHLPQSIIGDALRLEQVLLNLCMNAIKFTNRGRVKLQLDIVSESDDEVSIRFLIADTGIGMSAEQVAKLFKPFTQADGSTTRKFGGTGLGLVISKSLVELMGGQLEVSSAERVGSQFYFTLPFAVVHKRNELPWRVREDLREQPVWIVEDDEGMLAHWSAIVENFGLTPIVFQSWKTAKERLQRIGAGALPKLIILDMEMPDMYGAETWLEFHREAEAAGVKSIAMTTSYGRDEMMQLPAEQRPLTLLIKPILRTGMLRALEGAFDHKTKDGVVHRSASPVAARLEAAVHTRILLAEDNKINQLVAIEILKEQGYEVGLAENGEEVLHRLEEESWDLILMDIHMPVMDGSEAVRIIRSQSKYDNIPIIAVTANVLRNDHERYLKLGMNDVVTKPISSDGLHKVILYWLKESRKRIAEPTVKPAEHAVQAASQHAQASIGVLPQVKGMDVNETLVKVNGKTPILIHMLNQFRLDYDKFADQLRETLRSGEIEAAKRMVHTLKGAAGYLSAHELLDAVYEAERLIKQGAYDSDELQGAINRIEASQKILMEGLDEALQLFDKNS